MGSEMCIRDSPDSSGSYCSRRIPIAGNTSSSPAVVTPVVPSSGRASLSVLPLSLSLPVAGQTEGTRWWHGRRDGGQAPAPLPCHRGRGSSNPPSFPCFLLARRSLSLSGCGPGGASAGWRGQGDSGQAPADRRPPSFPLSLESPGQRSLHPPLPVLLLLFPKEQGPRAPSCFF